MAENDLLDIAAGSEPSGTPGAQIQEADDVANSVADLLREYDEHATPAQPVQSDRDLTDLDNLLAESQARVSDQLPKYDSRVDDLMIWAAGQKERDRIRQNLQDQQEFFRLAQQSLEGMPVGEDFAQRWLIAENATNAELASAWDHRYDSPEAEANARRVIRRTLDRLQKAARSVPDAGATEDRALVTAAVRGASKKPPPETSWQFESRLSNMSDAEFEREKQRMM